MLTICRSWQDATTDREVELAYQLQQHALQYAAGMAEATELLGELDVYAHYTGGGAVASAT